jgi:hypothetical protein
MGPRRMTHGLALMLGLPTRLTSRLGTNDTPAMMGTRKARRIGLSQVSTEAFHRY